MSSTPLSDGRLHSKFDRHACNDADLKRELLQKVGPCVAVDATLLRYQKRRPCVQVSASYQSYSTDPALLASGIVRPCGVPPMLCPPLLFLHGCGRVLTLAEALQTNLTALWSQLSMARCTRDSPRYSPGSLLRCRVAAESMSIRRAGRPRPLAGIDVHHDVLAAAE
jgi:hypothetical protein